MLLLVDVHVIVALALLRLVCIYDEYIPFVVTFMVILVMVLDAPFPGVNPELAP